MRKAVLTTLSVIGILGFSILLYEITGISRALVILLLYILLLIIFFKFKFSLKDIGANKPKIKPGVLTALPFVAVILLVVSAALIISPALFQDERYNQELSSVLFTVFIVIPLATAIIEELVFRGFLLGGLLKSFSATIANIISSLGFSFWHLFSSQSVQVSSFSLPWPLITLGVLVSTFIAGLFFGWLRLKSGSIVAPIIVHWSINSIGVVAAYIAWNT